MKQNDKLITEVNAIKVMQRPTDNASVKDFLNEYDFFIFKLPSDDLLKIAKFSSRNESNLGFQRQHKEDRDKEIGRFICSEHPFFPNTIIINIPYEYKNEYYNEKSNILKLDIFYSSAHIIDGQHRLKAFSSKYSKNIKFELVVSAYFGLELPTIAEIFTRINYFQKPVNKSLVYDLLDFNRDPEFVIFKEAHSLVIKLNQDIDSPFYGIIKILGVGDGFISQAALVEALTKRFKIIDLLKAKDISSEDIYNLIKRYFSSIKDFFKNKWANEKSILSKSVGINALVKVLSTIIKKEGFDYKTIEFNSYSEKMCKFDLNSETFGGLKGANDLADRFIKLLPN